MWGAEPWVLIINLPVRSGRNKSSTTRKPFSKLSNKFHDVKPLCGGGHHSLCPYYATCRTGTPQHIIQHHHPCFVMTTDNVFDTLQIQHLQRWSQTTMSKRKRGLYNKQTSATVSQKQIFCRKWDTALKIFWNREFDPQELCEHDETGEDLLYLACKGDMPVQLIE